MIRKLKENISEYDLCIIGAGPAGLVIAAELASSGLKICVLESGEEKSTVFANKLKEVQTRALLIKPNSRERILGGSGTVWGGLSAPLDEIDFEQREWSDGWPFGRSDLEQFWSRAHRYRFPDLKEFNHGSQRKGWNFNTLREKMFIAVRPPYNFVELKVIFAHEGVDLFLDATVTGLVSQVIEDNRSVESVICKTSEGVTVHVKARVFVLATGGIENPRILLHSRLGNEHDQVGRYFMNHPKGYAGYLRLSRPISRQNPCIARAIDGRIVYAGLTLPEDVQRTKGLLNSYVQFEPDLGVFQRYVFAIWRRLPAFASPLFNLLSPKVLRLRWYADMEPRAENRITLSEDKDSHGVAFPVVTYELGGRDKDTLELLHKYLSEEVQQLGIGRIEGTFADVVTAVNQDASHYLGATRMGRDPQKSVVDSNCKVHSVSNLYVAGGSTFSASGSANPTYTIVALAISLADHLLKILAKAGSAHDH